MQQCGQTEISVRVKLQKSQTWGGGGGQKGMTIYFHSIFNSNFCHSLQLFTSPGHVTVNVERFVDQKVKGNTNICIFI